MTRARSVLRAGGRTISERTLSKIRLGERGMGGAIDQLVRLGLPGPHHDEDPRMWLERLVSDGRLARHRHPGLFTYCFELTRAARKAGRLLPRLAYPRILPAF
jgi:hypothetical protein